MTCRTPKQIQSSRWDTTTAAKAAITHAVGRISLGLLHVAAVPPVYARFLPALRTSSVRRRRNCPAVGFGICPPGVGGKKTRHT